MNMKRAFATATILVALASGRDAHPAAWDDARSVAMAGSYTAVARGYNSIGFNPANLGLSDRPRFQLQLLSAGSSINNNAFSLDDYTRYNGEDLSEADRRDILAMIPSEGWEFRGTVAAATLSLAAGPLVLSATGEGAATGTLPREIVELVFFGNTMGETVTAGLAEGEAVAHADINLAYGYRFGEYGWGELAVGINLKYIYGIAWFDVGRSETSLTTVSEGIDADGSVLIRSSTGGRGMGLDAGMAARVGDKWTLSAGIRDAASFIKWTAETKITEYLFTVEGLNAETAGDSTTIVSEEIERPVESFNSTLAPQVNLGAARLCGDFLISADIKLGLKEGPGVSTRPQTALGAEYKGIGFLPLRAGISHGGFHGVSTGLGFGLKLSAFHIDFAWASSGTLLPSLHDGFSLAVSSGLDFYAKDAGDPGQASRRP